MRLTFKQGDTRHAIRAYLKNHAGQTVDLSFASVLFIMRRNCGQVTLEKQALIGEDNSVNVVFQSGETDIPGKYSAEFEVTYNDGRVETFPNSGYITVFIENRIGGV